MQMLGYKIEKNINFHRIPEDSDVKNYDGSQKII